MRREERRRAVLSTEIRRFCRRDFKQSELKTKMIQFLLGRDLFYKVTMTNGSIKPKSFKLDGTLKWGKLV
ncbi:MAG: hypothetical protein F4077_09760 [Gammaproteobacteria bacterium]|nr:hypothetical protein [Gammaproteobacteria bacterium]MYI78021.1 hypothetical protein [Gammaproteobacteria bacterium]